MANPTFKSAQRGFYDLLRLTLVTNKNSVRGSLGGLGMLPRWYHQRVNISYYMSFSSDDLNSVHKLMSSIDVITSWVSRNL